MSLLWAEEESEDPFPKISFTLPFLDCEAFHVNTENVRVATANNFPDAVLLLIATYFSFNLSYPAKATGMLMFLQKVILGHADNQKVNPKVTTLLSRLSSCQ